MTMPTLKARPRTEAETGTRACRNLRSAGEVPVNLYSAKKAGDKTELSNQNLAVSAYELYKLIDKAEDIIDLDLNGKIDLVRVTEVQRDTFGDDVLHIDLRSIDPETPVKATVKLEFSGKPQGIKDMALVELVVRELDIMVKPREIPTSIPVDLSIASAGETLLSGKIPLPNGATHVDAEVEVVIIGKSAA